MHATQLSSNGLSHEYKVVMPAADLEARLSAELVTIKDKVQINGFRPGKVPLAHLRKLYGRSVMADVLQNAINEANQKIVSDNNLKLAQEPQVKLPENQDEIEAVLAAKGDLSFTVALETLPTFDLVDVSKLELTKRVAKVSDEDLQQAIERMAKQHRAFSPKGDKAKAEEGDRLTIDFVGTIDGVAFEGGTGTDMPLELGSKSFIPGFEDQLIGVKAGETRTLTTSFPQNYLARHLAGKEATFEVTVKAVEAPEALVIDDELAKKFGMEDLNALKDAVTKAIEKDFETESRRRLKKDLLDAMEGLYDFPLPPTLAEQEFNGIWAGLQQEMTNEGKTFADEGSTEEKAREDYRAIANRRVKLGLVLAEIGEKAAIKVEDQEVTQALIERARQFPGQEKQVWDYYRKNPQALAELRAPIIEEKTIDHLLGQMTLVEKTVSRDELFADDNDGKEDTSTDKSVKSETSKGKVKKKA